MWKNWGWTKKAKETIEKKMKKEPSEKKEPEEKKEVAEPKVDKEREEADKAMERLRNQRTVEDRPIAEVYIVLRYLMDKQK